MVPDIVVYVMSASVYYGNSRAGLGQHICGHAFACAGAHYHHVIDFWHTVGL
jgi:hypothetical protein